MRASIVIAAHNEGILLTKTVQSCVETTSSLECELVVADDASTDGCVRQMRRYFPQVRVVSHWRRQGVSASKDLAARKARGNVLVFIDGHCKPEPWAIERLVNDVEDLEGKAVVVPRVPSLDPERWENNYGAVGSGFRLDLSNLESGWLTRDEMRPWQRYYVSPALVGCCLAVSKDLYRTLWGFDRHMEEYGAEDLDFGLKAWLMGYSVLNDPTAVIGHRFRKDFDTYSVSDDALLANKIRMARKNLSDGPWEQWIRRLRDSEPEFEAGWTRFQKRRRTAERERRYLLRNRLRDEFWYSDSFGLAWPEVG